MWLPKSIVTMKNFRWHTFFLVLVSIHISNGQSCQMEGVNFWPVPVSAEIWDWYRGEVTNRAVTNIEGINSVSYGGGLNRGPYLDVSLSNSRFIMSTNDEYPVYEEYETTETMSLTVNFSCTGGTNNNLVFIITVRDTNNNFPTFRPVDELEFLVMPPLPPGYLITGCLNNIIVRDIDLTTVRIDFDIEENPYFEIAYDSSVSTAVKDFAGVLRTKTFIRSLPEPIVLTISATDVDQTDDPPLTRSADIRITSSLEFEMPEELVFSQTFYLAAYTENDIVTLQNVISLQQGYDDLVIFSLEGDHMNYFAIVRNGNQISLTVSLSLPIEVLDEKQILLIIRAEREYTSGSTATILIELPEEINLEFERTHYSGNITDMDLNLSQIILSQGYESVEVSASITGEHSQYFDAIVQENVITLTMRPISVDVISENNFIYLELIASSSRSSATTMVMLEIIKDDNITPIFNQVIYNGYYNPSDNLVLDQILIVQGFDDTVDVNIAGDHADYFEIVQNGPAIDLRVSNLPSEIYSEGQIILSIEASKPRTVGANAAIIVTLPAARQLEFESSTYRGLLEDNTLTLGTITLSSGYEESITFDLTGDHSSYFRVSNVQNQVSVSLAAIIPDSVIMDNNFILLNLRASGPNAITTTTNIVLEIIKEDINTPVFNQKIYQGFYTGTSIEMESINLAQGFDASVTFRLEGVHSQYFAISNTGNDIVISLQSPIPDEVIFNEKMLFFNILAEKSLTVGANAAVSVRFPTELTDSVAMRFEKNTYIGFLEENVLTLENMILDVGFATGTEYRLSGEYFEYFTLLHESNVVSLTISSPLPLEVIENNKYIILEIEAQRDRAVPVSTTVLIDIVKADLVVLEFSQEYYRGVYSEYTGLLLSEPILLTNGFDETVEFILQGEFSPYFRISIEANVLRIELVRELPEEVIENNNVLILGIEASHQNSVRGYSVIVIELLKESAIEIPVFDRPYYTGEYSVESGLLFEYTIQLSQGYDETVSFTLSGDDSQWFRLLNRGPNDFSLIVIDEGIQEVQERSYLIFSVEANKLGAQSGNSAIMISLKDISSDRLLQFNQDFYTASIENDILLMDTIYLDGYAADVSYNLRGDYSDYFQLYNEEGAFTLQLRERLPDNETSNMIILTLEATITNVRRIHTTIIIELPTNNDREVGLIFEEDFYLGSYSEVTGLIFNTQIRLTEDYDEIITFSLVGDQSQWFELVQVQNSVTLRMISPIPPAVLAVNQQLVFVVTAQRPGSSTARTTVVISLGDEFTGDTILAFERINYQGVIENDVASLEPITLIQGYSGDVSFALRGELEPFFSLTSVGATVNIALRSPIPEQSMPANGLVVLELQATAPQALTAYATVVFTVLAEGGAVDPVLELTFSNAYYTGSYTASGGLVFENAISLSQGYDESVQFALEGDQSQWFELVQLQNSVTLRIISPIPPAVLAVNQQLVFVVTAQRPGSSTARTTVVISLGDEFTGDTILAFERINYQGVIENDVASLEPITLIQGYSGDVSFALRGELEPFFSLTSVGATVNIALRSPIPEQSMPANGLVVLELQATAPQALTAYATVVFTVLAEGGAVDPVLELTFSNAYYTGSYTASGGLVFENAISLSQGYDESVQFALEGDQSQWFELVQLQNSVTLRIISPIPPAVLAVNQQLVFVVTAQRPGSSTARTTVVISLGDEFTGDTILAFERINYQGVIENDVASLEPITLIQGYSGDVSFALRGELEPFFSLTSVGATVNIALRSPIPEQSMPANGLVVLELQATAPQALTAYATVVFTVLAEGGAVDPVLELTFSNAYYTGSYTASGGLVFENAISLSQGYDESVQFALEGDQSQWFELVQLQNSVTLRIISPIPPAVLAVNQQLVFVVTAQRPGSSTARTTVVISLGDEFTGDTILAFERINYQGVIENDVASLEPITLIQGYSGDVSFALRGELEPFFSLTSVGATVNIALRSSIPEQSMPANGLVVLELQATAPQALTAYATVVFTVLAEGGAVDPVLELTFSNAYYTGSYTASGGLVFENAISLSQGYDESVQFALEGDQSQWFELVQLQNSVTLRIISPIPPAVLAVNQQLVFVVTAQRPGSSTARTTVVISLGDEFTGDTILAFERINYQGVIENDVASLEPITLIQGYSGDVSFALRGELEPFFSLTSVGATVNIALRSPIPEQSMPANGLVVLELQATAPQALTAYATVVFTVLAEGGAVDPVLELTFSNAYYAGSYTASGGLVFENAISLSQGYDESVQFALEGDQSQWFELVQLQNSVTLRIISPIPPAVLAVNQQLVFVVTAQRPGSSTARTTVVISLGDEFTGDTILAFERINYQGVIENDVASLEPITLIQGYSGDVSFALRGELEPFFSLTSVGATVNIALRSPIPEQSMPANGLVVLELQATAPQALTAYATVVFTVLAEGGAVDPVLELTFSNAYYTGSYTASGGLVFENAISLSQGYDESVQFALEGDQSQWFELVQLQNSVTLRIISHIPPAVLAVNQQLVFVVTAQRPGSSTARTTVVISLGDEFTGDTILAFERINYQGVIENDVASLEPITLIQGYSGDVSFALRGELEPFFSLTSVGATVNIALRSPIPEQSMPANGLVVLELQATAPQALTAYATVVFTVLAEGGAVDPVLELTFSNAYYTGSYTASGGLVFENAISLSQGYDESVQFALEGDQSQWFELVQLQNSVTLRIISPIPPAVLAVNQQLVFVVTAQRPGSSTARTTVVISLGDEFTGDTILAFERINYQGVIENDVASLEPITLIQGYSGDVSFALRGELEPFFSLTSVGATVNIALRSPIPEQSMPANGLVVLELQATAPQALTAYATVVFTVLAEGGAVDPVLELTFSNAYYTGSYTASGGLVFENAISLSQGYDESVQFALEGDQSQWFELVQLQNSVTLRIISPIPPAVLAVNQQLVFVVTAQRPGSSTARTTVVISLGDEFTGDTILAFERINYQGVIENDVASLEPITLIQGYSGDVSFALRGELEPFFSLTSVGATVNIALRSPIPEQSMPANGLVVLELQATAPQALTAYATVVFTVLAEGGAVDPVLELTFSNAYYTGSYTASGGLVFENAISLSQGYDESVQFALEGDQSQWFELVQLQNSVTLRIISPIPPAVLAVNQQIVFVVTAQRPGSSTARTTVVISLGDEFTGDTILAFERINYQGVIENDVASLEPITLIQGYSGDVSFALRGELEPFFSLTSVGATVNIALRSPIPEQSMPANGLVVLELQATAPQALTAYATVVFTVLAEGGAVDPVLELTFSNAYYTGSYTASGGLVFENAISLSQGYDESVQFALEGDQSQWFELVQLQNSVTLRIISPIPPAVLAVNQQLVFVVTAQRPGSSTARTTVVISLGDEFTGDTILAFERINYQGVIENDVASLEPITLIQGYSGDVSFALRGELEPFFSLTSVGATVNIALRSPIPEQSMPANGLVVLELQATAPQALTAYATVVFTVLAEGGAIDPVLELTFSNAYYTGSYTASGGLVFENAISLSQGYDESVQFALEGDQSQWFELVQLQNSVTLRIISPIPPAVLAVNQQLVFVVTAQRPGSSTARTTVVISLGDEFTGDTILAFERINYQGVIENDVASLEPITLIQGYSGDVSFALRGELEPFFSLTSVGATVNIALRSPIPEQSMPANGLVVLELQATAPQALTAYATVVFTVLAEGGAVDPVLELTFSNAYYAGSYTASGGLVFENAISLSQGYDESVQFALEGDQSQWFELVQLQNSVTLRIISPIPPAVLAVNQQLVFVVTAQRPGSSTARTTVVISLGDEFTGDTILAFERINYQGVIENDVASLEPITLIQGYSGDVSFALRGELEPFFSLTSVGATVNIALRSPIPEQSMPANGLVVLELQATAPQALTAYATVVFTVLAEGGAVDPVLELTFSNAYYTGSYTASGGLVFENAISLSQSYDESVQFALEGDQSQWFELVQLQNSVTLRIISPIPPAVLAVNQQLVFVVTAQRPGSSTARTTVVISLGDEFTGDTILAFERINYQGVIENDVASLEPITLIQGYSGDVSFALRGELEPFFSLTSVGATVNIALRSPIPEQSMPANGLVVLELQATAPQALTAYATVVFTVLAEGGAVDPVLELTFSNAYYAGSYTASGGLVFENAISLSQGYDESVQFALEGDQSQWFELVQLQNSVTLRIISPIPPAVLAVNQQLVFVVTAQRPGSSTARTTVVISLGDEFTGDTILAFERINYQGVIENDVASLEPITLIQGYSGDVSFALRGELEPFFSLTSVGATVNIALRSPIPEQSMPANGLVVLELQATAPQALTAYATVVFTVLAEGGAVDPVLELTFSNAYYTGSYTASGGLVFENAISLSQGYDESVQFALEGDQSQWFELVQLQNSVTLRIISPIPPAVLAVNQQLVFVVTAQRPGSSTARTTVVISLGDEFTGDTILAFERINYQGVIENDVASLEPITLIQGYSGDVSFALRGELEPFFSLTSVGATVNIALRSPIPEQSMPANGLVVLELQATAPQALTAYATVVFTVLAEGGAVDPVLELTFSNAYYTGSYTASGGLVFGNAISLSQGYDESVQFALEGDQSQWFELVQLQNSVTLRIISPIPPAVLAVNQQLVFVVTAQRPGSSTARTTVIISFGDDNEIETGDAHFEKALYEGIVQGDIVVHETIVLTGFTGQNVNIIGEYASLFIAYISESTVSVQRSGLAAFPNDVTTLAIELHAGIARTVLLLNVIDTGIVNEPLVTFSSSSYMLRTEISQTGILGRVFASADNGEAILYSLILNNAHLQSRLSINNEGELYLSSPADSGVYTFGVLATTVFTQATGTATIYLTVEALTICGDDELVVPPLVILDRDEEVPHRNLVVLDSSRHEGCWYTLSNRWPIDQTWLYVDDTGLHATSIDREHESIAFMALSQVQVELVLHCNSDNAVRNKRSLEERRLGPYDYGNNKWVLTETIQYNSRRSFVNLIINDINDNAPIFDGKDQEPIAVGYPIPELIDTILPRALAELHATDADIGENAELLYWSPESLLAVSPSSGFVHVRDGAQIENGSQFTIYATDRNGEGLNGTIDIMVRLLDTNNIAVMTVRDAFLDDEKKIVEEISTNIGYEIKVLRSAVIANDIEAEFDNLRMKRDTLPFGAALQLYIYGLIAREPVTVDQLTIDINNNAIVTVNIASTVSLEDYLEGREICVIPGRDTGLLIATIILSVLLFIILVSIAVWYFLKRRNENYEQFSDQNSLATRDESFGQLPKPDLVMKPRLNIEDLKRSERRLQEMLDTPIEEVTVEPSTSKKEKPFESILDLPPPDSHVPIVIQSIDKLKDPEEDSDEDEFGENVNARRKSVVTFNENVEKIIHVEDDDDSGSHLGYEIFKL